MSLKIIIMASMRRFADREKSYVADNDQNIAINTVHRSSKFVYELVDMATKSLNSQSSSFLQVVFIRFYIMEKGHLYVLLCSCI